MERLVLGMTKINEGRRIYIPKSVLDELSMKIGDYILFKQKEKIFIMKGGNEGYKVDMRQRIYLPHEVLKKLGVEINDELIFMKEDGGITLSHLKDRIR